jgi:excisionase family DNA binding protein
MSPVSSKSADRIERPLTIRPSLSRAAVQFIEKHPDEVPRIVATALEAAAALEAAEGESVVPERALPEALRRLVTSARADTEAGRVLSISEAAELLEVTRVTIYAWIEAKRLLAWRATRRGMLIPAEQIVGPGKVVPGMERVLEVIPEPAAAWDFLTEESPFMDPNGLQRPIDALKAGELDAVVAAAHSFLEAFT